ncbi:MAG TPA: hypothetical protein VF746_25910 [Longimicrobium sp.]
MPRTRLLLAAVPPLLADIVRDALAEEPGVEVVGSAAGDLFDAVAASGAHVVLAENGGGGLSDLHLRLMYRYPRLKLLTVSPDGRRVALWRLVPERRVLSDPTPRGLAEAVRRAAEEG